MVEIYKDHLCDAVRGDDKMFYPSFEGIDGSQLFGWHLPFERAEDAIQKAQQCLETVIAKKAENFSALDPQKLIPLGRGGVKVWKDHGERVTISNPLVELALRLGVRNKSYPTVCYGHVASFSGSAVFEYRGCKIKAVGYGPVGNAYILRKEGGIKFSIA